MAMGVTNENKRKCLIIFLVFSSEKNMVESMKVVEHFANSDHNILVWQLILGTVMEKLHRFGEITGRLAMMGCTNVCRKEIGIAFVMAKNL